jgi:hypothetical protein
LSRLNPEKLSVTFIPPITKENPIIPRKYTLTHSDITGELFLTIGPEYDYEAIDPVMRDEVLAHWSNMNGQYMFNAYVYVNGQSGINSAARRYMIFKRELPLALEAIFYGDRKLLKEHPYLEDAPIFVHFYSMYPQYNRVEYFGTPKDYKI